MKNHIIMMMVVIAMERGIFFAGCHRDSRKEYNNDYDDDDDEMC